MNTRRFTKWITAVAVAVVMAVTFGATPAAAVTHPAGVGSNDCVGSGGAWIGNTSGTLENGLLSASFCKSTATGAIVKVHIEYRKDSGPAVTLRFGWQVVDTGATSASFTGWDNGAFVQTAGTTRGHFWTYTSSTGPKLSAIYKCVRGILRDQVTLIYYVTRLICAP